MYLSIFATHDNTPYFARIRRPIGWGINPERPLASRTALDGHDIHQAAGKDWSTAKVSISIEDRQDVASIIKAIDMAVTACFVSDGESVYEAIIDAKVTDRPADRKTINLNLAIVRKVV